MKRAPWGSPRNARLAARVGGGLHGGVFNATHALLDGTNQKARPTVTAHRLPSGVRGGKAPRQPLGGYTQGKLASGH